MYHSRVNKKVFGIIILLVCAVSLSVPVEAAGTKNKRAHQAYAQQLKKDKEDFGLNKLAYAYKDLDGNGIDELITYPGFDHATENIYIYRNGKVKQVAGVSMGYFEKYYKKNKILYGSRTNMRDYNSTYHEYFKLKGGKLVRKAHMLETSIYKSGKTESKYKYYVDGKKTTKKKYNSYVKKLLKGDKARYFSKMKWKKYK